MSDVLSDDEVAALFAAAEAGGAPRGQAPGHGRRRARVQPIDFSRPSKFTHEHERQIRRAQETFCRTAASRMSSELRAPLDLEVIGLEQLTWTSALADLSAKAICSVVEVEPIDRRVLLVADRPLMLSLIERLLGGDVDGVPRDRRLTDIDLALVRQVVDRLCEQMSIVWRELAEIGFRFAAFEPEPGMAQLAPLSEPTIVVTMEARLGGSSFILSLLVPYRAIEPIAARLNASDQMEQVDEQATRLMRTAVGDAEIELRAEVASVELTADEVLALKVGDVLRFDTPADAGVTVYADEVPVHHGRPGRWSSRRAVQIVRRADGEGLA